MPTLKEEWIERIKVINQRNIYPDGGGFFTVMTDFYKAPEEIRNDKDMCLKVLLEANECIWNVPKEIRTIEFLEEIIEKGYKGNILRSKSEWPEEDFPFLKKYLAKFKKEEKPKFDPWSLNKGVFGNREMVLSFVKEDNFHNIEYLLNYYNKDKEIMFALLDNHPNEIINFLKSIKNSYLKNNENIFKILKSSINNYKYLPEKFQIIEDVVDYVLSKDSYLFHHMPSVIKDNKEKTFKLIKKHYNITGQDISSIFKDDYEIAKFMIERHGSNFKSFNFIKNDELIRLAAKTYDNISHIPATEEYESLVREIILRANKSNNEINFSPSRGNRAKAIMVKDLLPQLLREDKIYIQTVSDFFISYVIKNEQNEQMYKEEKKLLIDCIKVSHKVYELINDFDRKKIEKDMEITHNYIESAKAKVQNLNSIYYYISGEIKDKANNEKIEIDLYVLNQYLSQKLTALPKVKAKKI